MHTFGVLAYLIFMFVLIFVLKPAARWEHERMEWRRVDEMEPPKKPEPEPSRSKAREGSLI